MKEEMKDTQNEIKQNIQETVTGRKSGLKAIIWNKGKKQTSNQNRIKKQEFKKVKSLTNLWDNLNVPISEL